MLIVNRAIELNFSNCYLGPWTFNCFSTLLSLIFVFVCDVAYALHVCGC